MSRSDSIDSQDAEAREGELRRQITEVLSTLKSVYKLAVCQPSKSYAELESAFNRLLKAYKSGARQLKLGRGLLGPHRTQFKVAFKQLVECRRRFFAEMAEAQHHWMSLSRQMGELVEEYGRLPVIHHPFRMINVLKELNEMSAIVHEPAFMLVKAQCSFKNALDMAVVALASEKKEKKNDGREYD